MIDPGSLGYDDWTIIPLMPKWLGFPANTIFFGGIAFLLFRWSLALRRHVAKDPCPDSSISTARALS